MSLCFQAFQGLNVLLIEHLSDNGSLCYSEKLGGPAANGAGKRKSTQTFFKEIFQ